MRSNFDIELNKLHNDLNEMVTFVDNAIAKAVEAFETDDFNLAKDVVDSDYIANDLELKIGKRSLKILLSQQPVASDLRRISSALKIITDMERISDQARDICAIVLTFQNSNFVMEVPEKIVMMAERSREMIKKCYTAFINNDLDLAKETMEFDKKINKLFFEVRSNLIELIESKSVDATRAIDYILIAKYFERIGDHAKNISEWIIFNITGEHKDRRLL